LPKYRFFVIICIVYTSYRRGSKQALTNKSSLGLKTIGREVGKKSALKRRSRSQYYTIKGDRVLWASSGIGTNEKVSSGVIPG
jgi:hypothetical protein